MHAVYEACIPSYPKASYYTGPGLPMFLKGLWVTIRFLYYSCNNIIIICMYTIRFYKDFIKSYGIHVVKDDTS